MEKEEEDEPDAGGRERERRFWALEGQVNDGNYDKYCQRVNEAN